jgi:hypothetical protein
VRCQAPGGHPSLSADTQGSWSQLHSWLVSSGRDQDPDCVVRWDLGEPLGSQRTQPLASKWRWQGLPPGLVAERTQRSRHFAECGVLQGHTALAWSSSLSLLYSEENPMVCATYPGCKVPLGGLWWGRRGKCWDLNSEPCACLGRHSIPRTIPLALFLCYFFR